jgi:endogenous inhibitor of DNA gyrase (YacG/DUF329 family)
MALPCPICKKEVAEPSEDGPATFPFCSDRCKLIDLGRWLDGKYQIEVPLHRADETDIES